MRSLNQAEDDAVFDQVFTCLKALLLEQSSDLVVVVDEPDHFYLDTRHIMKNNKPLFFAAVKINKRYVSFHLMPVYVFPELLADISPELQQRMQGKSCFNFTLVDKALFGQLKQVLARGRQAYQEAGYI